MSVKRLGFGVGMTLALGYLACASLMAVVPHDVAINFFNALTHGIDWEPIMRWEMPWWEMAIGFLQILVLGWLAGALVAALYNLVTPRN